MSEYNVVSLSMTRRRLVWMVLVVVLVALLGLTFVRLRQAALAARDGKRALLAASTELQNRHPDAAESLLREAKADFRRVRSALAGTGPVLPLARITPLVRVQARAMDTMAGAGETVADAGLRLMPTARRLLTPNGRPAATETIVSDLAASRPQVSAALAALTASRRKVAALDGYRLLGPLASAHKELETRLDEALRLGVQGQQTLTVLLDLAGADSPRSYLLLSQNPDEPRPTGGYMGTYGVLTGKGGHARLTRYGATGDWNVAHPTAAIPVADAPFPFGYASPPHPQSLGNVGTTPDWPASAELAARIWQRGGETPADGVITFTPPLLKRLLAVFGPTRVPGYPDVVTAATVDSRLEFYTHGEASLGKTDAQRKDFVGALAHAVVDRTLKAPTSRLTDVGRAMAASLERREASLWSTHADVQAAVTGLGWDGALPSGAGDFYADAEFAFASKNGRHLLRTFDHKVVLAADGTGSSVTTMVLRDTLPFAPGINIDSHAYVTPYGPQGGVLLPDADPSDATEPTLAGHPTAGWLRTAPPLGRTSLHVGWRANGLMFRRKDGWWDYALTWLPQPGHVGDVLRLEVTPPPGWRWRAGGPPTTVELNGPYVGHWLLAPEHG